MVVVVPLCDISWALMVLKKAVGTQDILVYVGKFGGSREDHSRAHYADHHDDHIDYL
jgi:hypothetical protein